MISDSIAARHDDGSLSRGGIRAYCRSACSVEAVSSLRMVVMGTFRWRRRRNLFHCGVVIPWPFLILLIHGKAVRFTLVGGVEAAPVSGELFLWPFRARVQKLLDARPLVLSVSHPGCRLGTLGPPLSLRRTRQAGGLPPPARFPTEALPPLDTFQKFTCGGKKEWFWLKRLVGCQTKLRRRDSPCKSGSPSKAPAFCFISEAAHELKARAAASRVYEGSRMFMIVNEPILATPE